jgi:hypothetical protein
LDELFQFLAVVHQEMLTIYCLHNLLV